jgi:hypothetical protein
LLAATLIACDTGPSRHAPQAAADPSGGPAPETIDRLRSLGYVGFTDERVLPGEREHPVTILDPERSGEGYSLFSNRDLTSAQLIDPLGNVVRSWQDRDARHWSNAELLPDGDLLVPGSLLVRPGGGGERSFLLRLSWDGSEVFRTMLNAHHDAEMMPDGRLACLTFDFRRIPEISPDADVKDNLIAILTPAGHVVEEHSLLDLLRTNPGEFSFQPVAAVVRRKTFVDLLHANSLEFMRHAHLVSRHPIYAPTNVLVSFRHQDTIAIFDWAAKRLLWAWGQGEISGQHDATVLANGNILLFDNGLARSWSRVLELDPLRREIVWEYHAPTPTDLFSLRKGSSQRLPNGNTLLANSDHGEALEVTPDGQTVWRFLNPNTSDDGRRATIVRIKRYPRALIETLLQRDAGRPSQAHLGAAARRPRRE